MHMPDQAGGVVNLPHILQLILAFAIIHSLCCPPICQHVSLYTAMANDERL